MELQHAKLTPYNVILLDRKIVTQNNIDITRSIRTKYGFDCTVIVLDEYSWDDIADKAIANGIDGFLPKPLFSKTILSELSYIINRRKNRYLPKKRKAKLNNRRVLIVEDMLINAMIIQELLSTKEIKVDHAENGKIAVDMFAKSRPFYYDAVLMDVRMPVMDGLQASQAIRNLVRPDSAVVPIIALTANAFDEDVQLSLQAGMNAHLSKPVEPESLLETLGELIYEFDKRKPLA